MEYEDLVQELTCPICLSLYTDPVSLSCGHNFCRLCIMKLLATQNRRAGYSCPYCRAKYLEYPTLEKINKMALDNIAERFLFIWSDMEETRVLCSYCRKSPVPAVRSCFHSELSFCDHHLMAHMKVVDCLLLEPTSSFDRYKCSIHKEILEYYCLRDSVCLCLSCLLVCRMRGHRVKLLNEAFEEKKKKKLRKYMCELIPQKATILMIVHNLKDQKRNIQEEASNMRRNIRKMFLGIKEQREMSEKKALSEISRQEEKIVSPISDLIRKLQMQENEVYRKMREVEKMCHDIDPMRLLRERDITIGGRWANKDKGIGGGNMVDSKTLKESDHGAACGDKSKAAHALVSDLQNVVDDLDQILVKMTLPQSVRDFVNNIKSESGVHVPDILLAVDTANKYVK